MPKSLAVLFVVLLTAAIGLQAQQFITPEAQAFLETSRQQELEGISQLHLAYAQLMAGLTALAILFNLRSVALVFLIGYGAFILNVPFHIPTVFQNVFGYGIIFISIIGLAARLILLRKSKPAEKKS